LAVPREGSAAGTVSSVRQVDGEVSVLRLLLRKVLAMIWRDVPGWFDFDDIYAEAVIEARPGARFVELGCAYGRSTAYLATLIRALERPDIHQAAIDIWAGAAGDERHRRICEQLGGPRAAFDYYLRACGPFAHEIEVRQADQLEAAPLVPVASLDLVFLDTCHTLKGTRAAIAAWLPKVRPGGVFAGHDFTEEWPGVVQAVAEMLPNAIRRRSSFFWRVPG
jgi:SAM-dependent methyltransferase